MVSLISTVATNKLLCLKNSRSQWFSAQMNNWRQWQLKKSKSWAPFGANSETALPIQPIHHENGPNGPISWQVTDGPQDFDFFHCHVKTFKLSGLV
jgi:hypothetical protein